MVLDLCKVVLFDCLVCSDILQYQILEGIATVIVGVIATLGSYFHLILRTID